MRVSGRIFLCIALVMVSACREPKKVLTEREKQLVQDSVLTDVPVGENIIPVNAVFDDKLVLLAYGLSKPSVNPGEAVTLSLYWKALTQIEGEYKIFMHFDSTKNQRKTFDHHAINNLYPVANWKPGEVIRDDVLIQVDSGFPQAAARLWLGLFDEKAWRDSKKNVRMVVKNAGLARADKENRLLLTTIMVGDAQVKSVAVKKAGAVSVDGDLSEAEWAAGFTAGGTLVAPDGKPLPEANKAEVGLMYDETYLYVGFRIKDSDVASSYTDLEKRDLTLWSGGDKRASDVVEIFIDPDGDGADYVELQVAPTGAVFDAKFDSHRNPKWEAAAASYTIELRQGVKVDGTLNGGGVDAGYTVEVAIPWAGLPGLTGVPAGGRPFRANVYRLSGNGPFAGTLAPVGNDFHDLSLAATLTFVP